VEDEADCRYYVPTSVLHLLVEWLQAYIHMGKKKNRRERDTETGPVEKEETCGAIGSFHDDVLLCEIITHLEDSFS
jgi:hypothetical protein